MKVLKLTSVSLTGLLVLSSFTGCGLSDNYSNNNHNAVIHSPISFESVKKGDLFYFLGKKTNKVAEYPTLGYNYSLIVIDMEDSDEYEISELQKRGIFVICYVDAGTWEGWRSDAALFPPESKGNGDVGWGDEFWLDINNPAVLPLIEKRIDVTAAKGCNGIEFDNIDGWSADNNTSFNITEQDQINFNAAIASYAHSKNLITAFKTDLEQIDTLEPYFDMAINESCHMWGECQLYDNFLSKNKPVFDIEYVDGSDKADPAMIDSANLHAQTDYFKSYLSNIALDGTYYVKLPLQ